MNIYLKTMVHNPFVIVYNPLTKGLESIEVILTKKTNWSDDESLL